MGQQQSKYDGIQNARYNEGGVYFLPGTYLVRVDKVKEGVTRQKKDFFVIETTTIESSNPERPVGGQQSQMIMMEWDNALGTIKNFASIAGDGDTSVPESEIDAASIELIVSEENPLKGTVLRVTATNVETKKGGTFTKVLWKAYEGDKKAALAKVGVAVDRF